VGSRPQTFLVHQFTVNKAGGLTVPPEFATMLLVPAALQFAKPATLGASRS
jgi:hypothetical protein